MTAPVPAGLEAGRAPMRPGPTAGVGRDGAVPRRRGPTLEIIVKGTDGCNACCLYCSAQSHPGRQRRLSIERAEALLREATRLVTTGRLGHVRILWHGGEPLLLGKAFFSRLVDAHRPGELSHGIQTNLTLLDEEWIRILEPLLGRDGVGTSVDPFDDVRTLPGGAYARAWLRSMAMLEEADWRVGCVYVLHRGGLARARELYGFFRNLRVGSGVSLRVNPLLHVGRAQGVACDDLTLAPGDYGRFLIDLARVWLEDRTRLVVEPLAAVWRALQGDTASLSCDLAGRAGCVEGRLGMDPDGNLYNCGRAVDAHAPPLGRLGDAPLEEFLGHPGRRPLFDREPALLAGACGTCRYWTLCHGGCPFEAHRIDGQVAPATQLCEDLQAFFRWAEEAWGRPGAPRILPSAPPRPSRPAPPPVRTWVTPAAHALDLPAGQIRLLVEDARDLAVASDLAEARRIVTLELPTSLHPAWEAARGGGRRVPEVSRWILDGEIEGLAPATRRFLLGSVPAVRMRSRADGRDADRVRGALAAGLRVELDRLRSWPAGVLAELGAWAAASPVPPPLEPFASVAASLRGGGRSFALAAYEAEDGATWHVAPDGSAAISPDPTLGFPRAATPQAVPPSGEPTPRPRLTPEWLDLPCATCSAHPSCGGFWLRPARQDASCRAWVLAVDRAREAQRAEPVPPR